MTFTVAGRSVVIDGDGITIAGTHQAIDWFWRDTYRPLPHWWGRITVRKTEP